MSASTFKCPQCHAPIFYPGGDDATIECMFCGHSVIVPAELRSAPSNPAELFKQVSALGDIAALARTDKLEAIKRYRQLFNVGLAEAQEAIEQMATGHIREATNLITTTPTFAGASAAPLTEPQALEQIQKHLGAGNKIEAIKVYRQATGVGLKEAKDAVEAMQAGQAIAFNVATPRLQSTAQDPATIAELRALLQRGNKIEAIKIYRQATGVGLKEAKDAVEAMQAGVVDANTFPTEAANAYPFQRPARPAATPVPNTPGLNFIVVGLIAGGVFLVMLGVAVALLVFNLAG